MRSKLPYIIVALLFIGYILLETLAPKPHDWEVTYGTKETKPFGTRLLHERLPDLFPGQPVKTVQNSPSKTLAEFESTKSNYIIVTGELDMASADAHSLLDFARRGNNVFIAAEMFTGPLADSLDIENKKAFLARTEDLNASATANNWLQFYEDSGFATTKHYPLMDYIHYNFFDKYPKGDFISLDENQNAVFVHLPMGDGHIFLHTVPLAFTNYYMVDPVNHEYISRSLSFMPVAPVIWDDYYKPGRVELDSSVAYLLESSALRWAWIMTLCTLLAYVVFEGKRRQRIIPIAEPATNNTLEFTETVSRLYLGHADHKDIAEKKVKFFKEYVHNRWVLSTQEFDEQFESRLAAKSGVAMQDIQDLCRNIRGIQAVKAIDAHALLLLNRKIESFYVNSQ